MLIKLKILLLRFDGKCKKASKFYFITSQTTNSRLLKAQVNIAKILMFICTAVQTISRDILIYVEPHQNIILILPAQEIFLM